MKKIKVICIISLILIFSLCVTACGRPEEVGNYTIYEVTSMGIKLDQTGLKDMKMKLTLNKDGTGNFFRRNENVELTWEEGVIMFKDEATPYEYNDGLLTITVTETDTLVFKKD